MIPEARGQLGLKISRQLYRLDIGAIGARAHHFTLAGLLNEHWGIQTNHSKSDDNAK